MRMRQNRSVHLSRKFCQRIAGQRLDVNRENKSFAGGWWWQKMWWWRNGGGEGDVGKDGGSVLVD